MKPKHSPLPWRQTKTPTGGPSCFVKDANEEMVLECASTADAEFAAHACNAHEELVSACKKALHYVEVAFPGGDIANALRAALKKALGDT